MLASADHPRRGSESGSCRFLLPISAAVLIILVLILVFMFLWHLASPSDLPSDSSSPPPDVPMIRDDQDDSFTFRPFGDESSLAKYVGNLATIHLDGQISLTDNGSVFLWILVLVLVFLALLCCLYPCCRKREATRTKRWTFCCCFFLLSLVLVCFYIALKYSNRSYQEIAPMMDFMPLEATEAKSAAGELGEAGGSESITNTQEANVDEGGIVKIQGGQYAIVLRRGRLFSIDLGDKSNRNTLKPISFIDCFPPGDSSRSVWYDEMLVDGLNILVIGYSYQQRASEIGVFRIDKVGRLSHKKTFFISSNDYYSSGNYASRIVENKLIMYLPFYFPSYVPSFSLENNPTVWPSVKAHSQRKWKSLFSPSNIYRVDRLDSQQRILHTVVVCDLSSESLSCSAQGVFGSSSRSFYVSSSSVYVSTQVSPSSGTSDSTQRSILFRLSLDVSKAPGILRIRGAPVNQFSFKETRDDDHLNLLLHPQSPGDWMWAPDSPSQMNELAFLRFPLSLFSSIVEEVPTKYYAKLEIPKEIADRGRFVNRFVGDHIIFGYGSWSSWGWQTKESKANGMAFAYRYRGAQSTGAGDSRGMHVIPLGHSVDRVEAIGSDAVVVGSQGGSLHYTSVELQMNDVVLKNTYVQFGSSQGETRSHGFFYRSTPDSDSFDGILGLPIVGSAQSTLPLDRGSALVSFLGVKDLKFEPLGALTASPGRERERDNCVVSCVDWYGNARPIFYRGRIFALLGYELVEGVLQQGKLSSVRRILFLPKTRTS